MSTKEREPLLSDEYVTKTAEEVHDEAPTTKSACVGIALGVRDLYEAARAKDAELIQQLVNAIEPQDCHHPYCLWVRDRRNECDCHMAVLDAAKAAGFTPSEP
jgi:hypothetical protein